MPTVLELREQVRQILTGEFNGVEVDSDGDFSIRNESTQVFVRIVEQELAEGRSRSIINVFAPVILNVQPSPQLFEAVATTGYLFGHLFVAPSNEDGTRNVVFEHRLLGDYLDTPELLAAVYAIAFTANELDEEFQSKFGGQRLYEN